MDKQLRTEVIALIQQQLSEWPAYCSWKKERDEKRARIEADHKAKADLEAKASLERFRALKDVVTVGKGQYMTPDGMLVHASYNAMGMACAYQFFPPPDDSNPIMKANTMRQYRDAKRAELTRSLARVRRHLTGTGVTSVGGGPDPDAEFVRGERD